MSAKRTQDDLDARGKPPSPHDRRRLSVTTLGVDDRTIIRAYLEPSRVRETTRIRLAAAAKQLGVAPPPEPDLPTTPKA